VPEWVWDAVGALFVVVSAFAHVPGGSEIDRTVIGYVAVLLPAACVMVRRRWPWPVLIVCVVCFVVAAFTFPSTPFSSLAVTIAVYTVSVRTDRRVTWITGLTVAALLVCAVAISEGSFLVPWVFQVVVTIGFGAALGDAIRNRRAYIAEITARAERAEATREAEASRRVAEDRLRIARDLHDVVAHQISVISLNAGVVSASLETRPEVAREALLTIRTASRQVLREIGDLLTMLRSPDDPLLALPSPGVAELDALVAEFERSGLHVTVRREGELDLPPAVDIVVYRVIQEGLTNVLKHSTQQRAHVMLSHDDALLKLVVTNPLGDPAPVATGSGQGLVGIRERVAAVRGRTTAGVDGGTFRLDVEIPLGDNATGRS
jgi:signal transduction histidine kinase